LTITTKTGKIPSNGERRHVQELRIARSKAGMTLMELETASGVGASTISKIERGVSRPQAGTLHKLADALGVEVDEFYPKAEAPRPETQEYVDLLKERCYSSEQIAAWLAQQERNKEFEMRERGNIENMSAKDLLEELLASPGLRRILEYHRENDPEPHTPPKSESA
jgi:transcriptional regulator with XRE-family HTH domain